MYVSGTLRCVLGIQIRIQDVLIRTLRYVHGTLRYVSRTLKYVPRTLMYVSGALRYVSLRYGSKTLRTSRHPYYLTHSSVLRCQTIAKVHNFV